MNASFGIVGAGYISQFHFEALKNLNVPVRVVADINRDAATQKAAPFGARVTTDWQDVVNDPDVNTVLILTSTPAHKAIAEAAMKNKKHVICEKTLTNAPEDSAYLGELAGAENVLLFTSYMKRFFPAAQKAKALMPALGHIMSVTCRTYQGTAPANMHTGELPDAFRADASGSSHLKRATGGGILVCGGSHILDMLLFLVGKPSSVFATQFRRADSDIDFMTHALYSYDAGAVCHFEGNWHPLATIGFQQSGWDEGFEIRGTDGVLVLQTPVWNEPLRNAAQLSYYNNADATWTTFDFPIVCPFQEAQRFYIDAIAKQTQPDSFDRFVGYRTDKLLAVTQAAADAGKSVSIDWQY